MLTIVAIAGAISVVITALGLLWSKVVKPSARLVQKSHKAFDKVLAYDDRIATIEVRTRQLTGNGGSHVFDKVNKALAFGEATNALLIDHIALTRATEQKIQLDLTNQEATIKGDLKSQTEEVKARLDEHDSEAKLERARIATQVTKLEDKLSEELLDIWKSIGIGNVTKMAESMIPAQVDVTLKPENKQ